ncbi:hypothetical protein FGG08_007132 [Glutinoglossum americanum]|uniref:Major facilitator superfamily (MFS) profile domain-containing protein n=1 Tax=Glutinoglossum americanum TaxID=1670608 RepID=A0A9P8HZI0_9PEZI|nr:hypothetical protein FGG08_007132 [Glutinoglossum americanum]
MGPPTATEKESGFSDTSTPTPPDTDNSNGNNDKSNNDVLEPTTTNEKSHALRITPSHPSTITDLPDDQYPHGLKLISIIIALCLSVFLVALDQTIISTAIPRITDHFGSIGDIGWYGSAYFLTTTALQPTFGRVYKVFNVKTTFLTVIGLFELGSLICGAAPTSKALVIGRAIAGIGVGGIFSGALVILALPIGAVSILVILFILKVPRVDNAEGKSIKERILDLDLIGASILIPTIICLLLALQWGGTTYPWKNSRIIGLLVGAWVMACIFIYSQLRLGDAATLPPRILSQRSVCAGAVYAVMFGAGFFVLMFYLPLYFQSVKGSSATKSGIQVLPLLLATVISSVVTGGLITAMGYYTPIIIVSTAVFCIGAGFISTFSTHTSFARWFGYQVLAGAGIGVGFQAPMLAVQTVLPLEDVPVGTAIAMFFQTLGGALFISIGQTVFQNGLVRGTHTFVPDIDPKLLLNAGATQIRNVLAKAGKLDELPGAIEAYMVGLRDSYRVTIACTAVAFVAACFLEWKSVKDGEAKRLGQEGGEPAIAVTRTMDDHPVMTPIQFRPALLVIDLQEDFCPPNGSLAVAGGRDTVPIINDLLDLPFTLKIATKDFHPPDHISFASNHEAPNNQPFTSTVKITNPYNPSEVRETCLWPIHCVQGTPGADLLPELHVDGLDHIIEKGQDKRVEMYSAFTDIFGNSSVTSNGLSEILTATAITHVFLVGLAMDYCVKWSAIDARKAGFVTYVVREGTKAVDPGDGGWDATQKEFENLGVSIISATGPEVDRVRRRQ